VSSGAAWWQRLTAEKLSAVLHWWLEKQARFDADLDELDAVPEPGTAALVGREWVASLGRRDIADEAARAAVHCWGLVQSGAPWASLVRVCEVRGVDAPALLPVHRPKMGSRPAVARVTCRRWWAGRLRRARAVALAISEQPEVWAYASSRARHEYQLRRADAAAWAQSATLVRHDTGERWSMADLIAKSTANPEIRAAELVTRVKGCAEWGEQSGWKPLFVTLTAPGHMHPNAGKRWTGESAVDVQAHLALCWARFRAWLWRVVPECRRPIGVRVVEPHQDGTPHWHLVVWVHPDHVEEFAAGLWRYFWEQHRPDERGSERVRVKIEAVRDGSRGAVGYVLKYVLKHTGHLGSKAETRQLEQDYEIPGSTGVDVDAVGAWASDWGIRTWQAVGGPPVTVWRALRRAEGLGGEGFKAPDGMADAVASADSGDWAGFMAAAREESGRWRKLRAVRSGAVRWDSARGEHYEAAPTRYGEDPVPVVEGVALMGSADGDGALMVLRARRYRWVSMSGSASAVQAEREARALGHVSLTVRTQEEGAAEGRESVEEAEKRAKRGRVWEAVQHAIAAGFDERGVLDVIRSVR
jgi:hypothetical protein